MSLTLYSRKISHVLSAYLPLLPDQLIFTSYVANENNLCICDEFSIPLFSQENNIKLILVMANFLNGQCKAKWFCNQHS